MPEALGHPIPANTEHAVSVSLPSWKSTVGYEEGEDWVLSKMKTGYPRFFIHKLIQKLANKIVADYGSPDQTAILFPSKKKAELCVRFLKDKVPDLKDSEVRILSLVPVQHADHATQLEGPPVTSNLSAVLYPAAHAGVAKQVWQHSGDGVSSRRAEFCYTALEEGLMVEESATSSTPPRPDTSVRRVTKGPRRYQRGGSLNGISIDNSVKQETSTPVQTPTLTPAANGADFAQFIEERYGRNLSVQLEKKAKLAVRRRIAGCLKSDIDLPEALSEPVVDSRVSGVTEADVSLYPNGMSSIFNTHQLLLAARGPMKSICFGFPYIDTLKILQKWGPGCQFYGNGVDEDLDDLEKRLESGERYLALFTEFPGNPLLRSPNLARIRALADRYDFAIVVDETVGNFVNVNVLRLADVVVSSLTKVFSGDSNVMGGSSILNPNGRYYPLLKKTLATEYEDNLWAEDAVFLERNSRDYLSRIERINFTANALANLLNSSPLVKKTYYPTLVPSFKNYEACRNPNGGYGGLLSVTFPHTADSVIFFDTLNVQKGPSLGTNFTLSCPYTILAHYGELEWAAQFGVESDLVRISVGLEEVGDLCERVQIALDAVKARREEEGKNASSS